MRYSIVKFKQNMIIYTKDEIVIVIADKVFYNGMKRNCFFIIRDKKIIFRLNDGTFKSSDDAKVLARGKA